MAQDTRKITIEIVSSGKSNSGGSSGGFSAASENKKKFDLEKMLFPMNSATNKVDQSLFGKMFSVSQAYQNTKQLILNGAEMTLNRYFNMSENYIAESTFNNVKNIAGKGLSFASAVTAGAMTGGAFGMAIGAGAWVAKEAMAYNNTLSNYHSSLNAANFGTQFSNTRASLYDGGKGTEN